MQLHRVKQPVVCNDKGEPIELNAAEKWACRQLQNQLNNSVYYRMKNALGYEIAITTLTTIS
jgi:hypothetical protein